MATSPEAIRRIDKLIRDAEFPRARTLFMAAVKRPVPSRLRADFALLALRLGKPAIAARLLHHAVRGSAGRAASANETERAVYAHALTQLGAVDESIRLLRELTAAHRPRSADFYLGIALVTSWDYAEAAPHFQRYLTLRSLSPYQRLVGEMNLAACYIVTRDYRRATMILRRLLHETSVRKLRRLGVNALELCAQNYFRQKDWDNAASAVARARALVSHTDALDLLWLRKWEALIALRGGENRSGATAKLRAFRAEARAAGDWESLRDCDRHEAIRTGDQRLVCKVWAGTPYPAFRARFLEEMQDGGGLPESFAWSEKPGTPVALDLTNHRALSDRHLKPGSLTLRVLRALCLDLYRPIRVPRLFELLHPGEYFNPLSSPGRVHEGMRRVRAWLADEKSAIDIEFVKDDGYRIALNGAAILLPVAGSPTSVDSPAELLRRELGTRPFSSREAAAVLSMPRRSVQRVLENEVVGGCLSRTGLGRATRYQITK